MPGTPGFKMMQTPAREEYGVPATPTESSLPFIKPEDYQVIFWDFVVEGGVRVGIGSGVR